MKNLIENSFALSTKILRKDLQKARSKEPVEGYLNILIQGSPDVLDYKVEYEDENAYLAVYFDAEPQKILLSHEELTFGTRTYLTCGCGLRTNALYLKDKFFACRRCQSLGYSSNRINRSSDHGYMLYQNSRRLKLISMREEIDRIFYRSKFTKKFTRFLKLCEQAGLLGPVRDAKATIKAVKDFQAQQI